MFDSRYVDKIIRINYRILIMDLNFLCYINFVNFIVLESLIFVSIIIVSF